MGRDWFLIKTVETKMSKSAFHFIPFDDINHIGVTDESIFIDTINKGSHKIAYDEKLFNELIKLTDTTNDYKRIIGEADKGSSN